MQAASDAYNSSLDPSLRLDLDKLAKHVMETHTPDGHVLLGLLSYYSATSSFDAFSAAREMGDKLLQAASVPNATLSGIAPEDLLEPFVALYRFTAEDRYLELSKSLAHLGTGPADKPYESLTRLRGTLELYRLTGNETYLKPVTAAWKDFAENRIASTGTMATDRSEAADDCVTAAWLRL